MTARVAVYYAPTAEDPLTAAAAAWTGRNAETNAPCPQPDIPDIAAVTADARLYGFHATLKPPMRLTRPSGPMHLTRPSGPMHLTQPWAAFLDAAAALARTLPAFDLPPLAVADLHGFLALRETQASATLQHLADACVTGLDRFRAPPPPEETARRRRATLTADQNAMLVRWGYPYVLDTWFFHMTLTRRLTPAEHAVFRPRAEEHFAAALAVPRRVSEICLFTQSAPGAAFTIAERLKLLG